MKRKLLGEIIQEIIEHQMILSMCHKSDDSYNIGRIQGLKDAIEIIQTFF